MVLWSWSLPAVSGGGRPGLQDPDYRGEENDTEGPPNLSSSLEFDVRPS